MPEDLDFLVSAEGRAALAWAAGLDFSPSGRIAATSAVRAALPGHHTAVVDVVAARERAAGRLRDAADWVLTGEAVQQATAWPVAAARAARLAGRVVHDATCSVGAELTELVRVCPAVVGSDLDPLRARMAAHNVPRAQVAVADALHPVTTGAVLLVDPARRDGGGRVHDPERLSPPLGAVLEVCRGREFAVKCAPGLDAEAVVRRHPGELTVELVSLDGSVRETCLWSPGLQAAHRRATVLRRHRAGGVLAEVVTDSEPDDVPADGRPGEFVIDPDGAVVRAHLVRHWAHRHGLRQLDRRIAHLTGESIPAGYSGFPVLARHRLDRKELRRALRARDCGSLEILVRGVDVDPDRLRRELPTSGSEALSLVVTRIGGDAVVLLCGPRTPGPAAEPDMGSDHGPAATGFAVGSPGRYLLPIQQAITYVVEGEEEGPLPM